MNNKLIKFHRGVDNTVHFRVRDTDLKAVTVKGLTVKAQLHSTENRERIFERYLTVGNDCGWLKLEVTEGDLVDVSPGHYQLVITQETQDSSTPLYSDQADNISFDVEITSQGQTSPTPSVTILTNQLIPSYYPGRPPEWHTSAISCNAIRNHLNSTHTFSIILDNFTGTVEVLGSLDLQPPSNLSEYFPLQLSPGETTLSYSAFTGIDAYSFDANVSWVKFRITDLSPDSQGTIEKISWRS